MDAKDDLRPALVPFLKHDDSGKPYLAGTSCSACDLTYVGERAICAKCASGDHMKPVRLAETGKVYVFTIVHRSFPGVEAPFVDVIVDLDDGAHIKGTLRGVEPDPEHIPFDLPVRVVYREVEPVNKPGKPHLTYMFEPLAQEKEG